MKVGDRIFVNKPLINKELEKEPCLFIEEIEEKGVVIMGGSREEKEFILNGSFTTAPTKINTNKPLYRKGTKVEMQRNYAKLLNKIY